MEKTNFIQVDIKEEYAKSGNIKGKAILDLTTGKLFDISMEYTSKKDKTSLSNTILTCGGNSTAYEMRRLSRYEGVILEDIAVKIKSASEENPSDFTFVSDPTAIKILNRDEIEEKMENGDAEQNFVLSYNPAPEDAMLLGHYISHGQELFRFDEDGMILEFKDPTGDYGKLLEVLGTSKADFVGWMTSVADEANKHIGESDYFSEYSPRDVMHSKAAKENKFMYSLYQEFENLTGAPTELVFLLKGSLDFMASAAENKQKLCIGKKISVGLYDGLNGGGSLLEIELPNTLTIDLSKNENYRNFSLRVDGVGTEFSIQDTYMVDSSMWSHDYAASTDKAHVHQTIQSVMPSAETFREEQGLLQKQSM